MIRKWIYKIRYILLILSALLGLLGVSWAFAYEYRYTISNTPKYIEIIDNDRIINTQAAANWWDYSWTIDSIWNIETTYNWQDSMGIYLPINNPYNQIYNSSSVFWNNDQLYYYNPYFQGYYSYFCTWSIDNYVNQLDNDFIKCLTPWNGWLLSWSVETNISYLTPIEEFNTNWVYHNNIVAFLYVDSNWQWNYNAVNSPFWFVYSDNSFVIFPMYLDSPNNVANLTWSLGITLDNPMTFWKFDSLNSLKDVAPIVNWGWSVGWDITTDTWTFTNYDAILWYGYVYWFSEAFCYWGYSLDNIFYPTENPEDFTWFQLWSWAYIYDIYEAYSWTYFSSASQFYQSFYSRYLINNIASFYNYPKALYWIVERYAMLYDHYQTYDPNVWISKLVSYCELRKLDPSAEYTWGDISAIDWFNSLIGEITDKWRYYESGPISILSWENIKFWSDEFFTSILNKINTSLEGVSNNAVGVIPRYILVVLVAIILFRIMSH